MNGFIDLIKPPGLSSGGAVAAVKRLTGEKVGHAGTLDPEASGVLPIMVGRATRLLNFFSEKEKTYIAEISFHGATDTQDAQGEIIEKGCGKPEHQEFLRVLDEMTGEIDQCPPAYSALKRDGTPLYKLARQGIEVKTEARKTWIYAIDVLGETEDGYMIRVQCGGGTYIRTLCHDIGQKLHHPAHMKFLLRTQVGIFDIENGVTLEQLQEAKENGTLEACILPMDEPLGHLHRIDVPAKFTKQVLNGVALPAEWLNATETDGPCTIYLNDDLIGIARNVDGFMKFHVIVKNYAD